MAGGIFYKATGKKRKRTKRRKTYRANPRSLISMGVPSGMQTSRVGNLRYVEQLTLTAQSALGVYVFRANSLFDPNFTGTGHQPMGRDQWATLYNHYVVLGSKCKVTFCPQSVATTAMCGVYLTDTSGAPYTDSDYFQEARKGTTKLLSGVQGKKETVITKYSAKKFFNVTNVNDNISRLGSGMESTPSEDAYFMVWIQDKTAVAQAVTVIVEIDYIASFSEPKDLIAS